MLENYQVSKQLGISRSAQLHGVSFLKCENSALAALNSVCLQRRSRPGLISQSTLDNVTAESDISCSVKMD
jgi:hypothetical protein